MARKKRTKKRYMELFDNSMSLFPPHGQESKGVAVILFPNGENEIWLKTEDGKHGVCLTASCGKAGMGITIRTFPYGKDLTVRSYNRQYGNAHPTVEDVREVCVTSYNDDPHSRAFSRWYDEKATEEDIALLGEGYRRKSRDSHCPDPNKLGGNGD